jgi:hypothetical protein
VQARDVLEKESGILIGDRLCDTRKEIAANGAVFEVDVGTGFLGSCSQAEVFTGIAHESLAGCIRLSRHRGEKQLPPIG